jgi:hypothetical protein
VLRAGDGRRLNDAPPGAGAERDAERIQRRREQARNQCPTRDSDREEESGEYTLLPTHVFPPPADNIPGGTIGRKVASLDIKGF